GEQGQEAELSRSHRWCGRVGSTAGIGMVWHLVGAYYPTAAAKLSAQFTDYSPALESLRAMVGLAPG
ncbi:MAG: hypothetical protein Q8R28_20575, partial [Dehalococcoidia bacterium]|nr:hypothetical protein [Dehalococcoidia bacterium]